MKATDMEIRSFYSDPFAAAWMADKFGFRFGDQRTAYPIPFCHDVIDEDRLNGRPAKYYVHAESLHLLEPQDGDVGQDDSGYWYMWNPVVKRWVAIQVMAEMQPDGEVTIIQRKGIAFMYPKKETPEPSRE
jgi:hypothetical protein